ncbi:PiggyBac transposable element-derived protein 4 [Elysia marginata]|uniref:PiggyBac transposable element-derived protein 4 n=1 Tax=Elysia marginata TaxID=1093978 RepID=A0AAV4EP68_9GAST|nr:PiggyBac transposable element-derived protein 4 [Elysia marginata]
MSVVGTLRRNKRLIPPEFQDQTLTQKGEPKFCFRKDAMLVSYKSGANKNVILMSSMHSDSAIVVNKHNKEMPEVVSYYNSTNGGVDTMDLMAHTVSSKRQTKRWPMVMFYNILDIGSIAVSVVYSTKYPTEQLSKTDNRREFQLSISKDLIMPVIERRRKTPRLPKQLICATDLLLGHDPLAADLPESAQPLSASAIPRASKRPRCARCPGRLDRKTSVFCSKCKVPVCKEHSVVICSVCGI